MRLGHGSENHVDRKLTTCLRAKPKMAYVCTEASFCWKSTKKFLNTADTVWIRQLGNCPGWIYVDSYSKTANTSEDWKVSRKITEGLISEKRNTGVTGGLICSEELRQRGVTGGLICSEELRQRDGGKLPVRWHMHGTGTCSTEPDVPHDITQGQYLTCYTNLTPFVWYVASEKVSTRTFQLTNCSIFNTEGSFLLNTENHNRNKRSGNVNKPNIIKDKQKDHHEKSNIQSRTNTFVNLFHDIICGNTTMFTGYV